MKRRPSAQVHGGPHAPLLRHLPNVPSLPDAHGGGGFSGDSWLVGGHAAPRSDLPVLSKRPSVGRDIGAAVAAAAAAPGATAHAHVLEPLLLQPSTDAAAVSPLSPLSSQLPVAHPFAADAARPPDPVVVRPHGLVASASVGSLPGVSPAAVVGWTHGPMPPSLSPLLPAPAAAARGRSPPPPHPDFVLLPATPQAAASSLHHGGSNATVLPVARSRDSSPSRLEPLRSPQQQQQHSSAAVSPLLPASISGQHQHHHQQQPSPAPHHNQHATLPSVPSASPTTGFLSATTPAAAVSTTSLRTLKHSASAPAIVERPLEKFRRVVTRLFANDNGVKNLDLRDKQIRDEGCEQLAHSLLYNSTLTELDLTRNSLTLTGIREVALALMTNKSLIKLDLSCNAAGDSGATYVAQTIEANSSLTQLDLRGNEIGQQGARAISAALQHNKTLTSLSMPYNDIGDTGARELASALKKPGSTLRLVNLAFADIGDAGALELALALESNAVLTSLNLSGNHIGDAGAAYLADSLLQNVTLTKLDLSDNEIGPSGAKALASMLRGNDVLANLQLGGNAATGQAVGDFLRALETNTTLVDLNLELHNIELWKEMKLRLQHNRQNQPLPRTPAAPLPLQSEETPTASPKVSKLKQQQQQPPPPETVGPSSPERQTLATGGLLQVPSGPFTPNSRPVTVPPVLRGSPVEPEFVQGARRIKNLEDEILHQATHYSEKAHELLERRRELDGQLRDCQMHISDELTGIAARLFNLQRDVTDDRREFRLPSRDARSDAHDENGRLVRSMTIVKFADDAPPLLPFLPAGLVKPATAGAASFSADALPDVATSRSDESLWSNRSDVSDANAGPSSSVSMPSIPSAASRRASSDDDEPVVIAPPVVVAHREQLVKRQASLTDLRLRQLVESEPSTRPTSSFAARRPVSPSTSSDASNLSTRSSPESERTPPMEELSARSL